MFHVEPYKLWIVPRETSSGSNSLSAVPRETSASWLNLRAAKNYTSFRTWNADRSIHFHPGFPETFAASPSPSQRTSDPLELSDWQDQFRKPSSILTALAET